MDPRTSLDTKEWEKSALLRHSGSIPSRSARTKTPCRLSYLALTYRPIYSRVPIIRANCGWGYLELQEIRITRNWLYRAWGLFFWKVEDTRSKLATGWTKKQQVAYSTVVFSGQSHVSVYIVQYCKRKPYKWESFKWKISKSSKFNVYCKFKKVVYTWGMYKRGFTLVFCKSLIIRSARIARNHEIPELELLELSFTYSWLIHSHAMDMDITKVVTSEIQHSHYIIN